ncbi:MAG: PepSY-associated TM helix domain-containing protein [Pseudomonadota bacterium]
MSVSDRASSAPIRNKPVKKKKSARKKLYELHTWVGFHLATLMFVVLFTGTVATVSNEIDWALQHDMRVSPEGAQVSWGEMMAAVEAAYPESRVTRLQEMMGDHFAFRADVVDPYGVRRYVHVNQWTGEVTGATHPLTVQRVFRDLHRYLFMPGLIGLPIVCSMAFILCISLYTGLKTSRNWRTLMTRVRFSKGARTAVGDAHKAAALWGIWFFVVIIATSFWYLAEWSARFGDAQFVPERPRITAEQAAGFGDTFPHHDTNEIMDAAQAAMPSLKIDNIIFSSRATAPILVNGSRGNPILRNRANQVFLNPATLEPLKVQYSENIGWVAWLNETADPIHFGFFGGLPTKLIWFVFGVAMTGLSGTGVWLTYRRLKNISVSRAQIATFPVFLLATFFALQYFDRYDFPTPPASERLLTPASVEAITAAPRLAERADGALSGAVQIRLGAHGARINGSAASVWLVGEGLGNSGPVRVPLRLQVAHVPVRAEFPPEDLAAADTLMASIELASGRQIAFEWPLP